MTVAARKKPAPPPPVPVPDYDLSEIPRKMDESGEDVKDGTTTFRSKPEANKSAVRVSIGTYQDLRPEPTKLDFLPPKRHSTSPGGVGKPSDGAIKNQLQTELNQTLSRARLRQRVPSSDLADEETKKPPAEMNPVVPVSNEIPPEKSRPPPVLSTFRRAPSSDIQAKMASLAAASTTLGGSTRDVTISQSADNKVTIKVHPYVSRTDFGQT